MALIIKAPPRFTLQVVQRNWETMANSVEMEKVPEALLNNVVYFKNQVEKIKDRKTAALVARQITCYCYNKKPAVDFQAEVKGV